MGVNSTSSDNSPFISSDGLTLVFISRRGGPSDLYEATRVDRSSPFTGVTRLAVSSTSYEDEPWLSIDDLRLYFASTRSGDLDIWVAERPDSAAPFETPTRVGGVNVAGSDDRSMTLSSDELEMILVSDRPGSRGYDLWHATRPSRTAGFSEPVRMTELDSNQDEYGPALSADGATLYFNYDTSVSGGGDADIWMATRDCL